MIPRKRKVKARHARAGHWKATPDQMFSSSRLHYEIGANTDAMSYGGIGACIDWSRSSGSPKRSTNGCSF